MGRLHITAVGILCATVFQMTVSCGFEWETVAQKATPGGCVVAKAHLGGALNPALLEVRLYDECPSEGDDRLLLRMDRKHEGAQVDLPTGNTIAVTTYNEADEWLKIIYLFNLDNLPDDALAISGDDMWKGLQHTSADGAESTAVQVGKLLNYGRSTWLVELYWYCTDASLPPEIPSKYGTTRISNEIVVVNASDVRFWIVSDRRAVGAITWESTSGIDTLSIVMPDTAGHFLMIGPPHEGHDAS